MLDIVLETIRAALLLALVVFLWKTGRHRFDSARKGWNLILAGFGLLLLGSCLDITDNFESLNRFVVIGDTKLEAFLEKFVGFLGGFVVLALGLVRWIPSVQRLSDEVSQRKRAEEAIRKAHDRLEERVQERTSALEKANLDLKAEMAERSRVEEALRQSEVLFRAFIDNLPNEMFIRDAGSRFLVVNREWQKAQGLTSEETIGKTLHEIFPEARANIYLAQDRIVLETGQVHDEEVEIASDGDAQTLRTIKFPIPIGDHGTALIGGIAIDITERKRAQESLRQSEERFRAVVNNSPTKIHIKDAEGRYVLVNREAEKLFGVTDEKARGRTTHELFPQMQADAFRAHDQTVLETGQTVVEEEEWLREDGIHTFLTVKFPILDSAGRITGVGAIGTDITERKRVEEALERLKQQNELILSSAGEGIYGLDTQGRSTFVNPAAAKMIGWDAEDLIGKPQHDILHHTKADGSPYPREECPIYAVFKDGGVHHVTDEVFWRKDGSSFPVEYVSTPIREHGEITGAVVIFRDISDRKRAEEAMRTAKEQAEVANRTKSEFLANMSHELRTPLNAIIGFSELIESEILGPVGNGSYRDYAGDIRESGRHLLDLINDILDLSKVESGSDELLEESIEVAEATRSVLMMVKRRAEKGGVELETEVPDDLPPLRADSRKLKQILVNLLSNGVKFTDTGGRVTLRAWCRPDSGHVFQIVDTGIGISLQDIPKALSPFQQIDSELNRKYEGTGLGLPLTKALVELHGGTLDLQSQVGIGTTVTVRFPAERVAVLRDDAGPLAAKAS